jgi:hypothetical protein
MFGTFLDPKFIVILHCCIFVKFGLSKKGKEQAIPEKGKICSDAINMFYC